MENKRFLLFGFLNMFYLLYLPLLLFASQFSEEDKACAACGAFSGIFLFIIIALIVINLAILIWVAKDAKARGISSAVGWLILMFLIGPIGLIIYIFSRPKGNLIKCPSCSNKKLEAMAKCPHCGN